MLSRNCWAAVADIQATKQSLPSSLMHHPELACSLPAQLLKMLAQFRSFGQNCLSQLTMQGTSPSSPSLFGYIFSTPPPPQSEQNFAQSIFSLLSPAPCSQHKSFPLSDLLACDWQAITISNFISVEDNKTWYHNYPQSLQSIHVHSNNLVRCC